VSPHVQRSLSTSFPSAQVGQAYGTCASTAILVVLTLRRLSGLTEMTTTVAMVSFTQQRPPLGSTLVSIAAVTLCSQDRPGAGKLLPGIRARVHKADGRLAKCGERGELFVSGPSNALSYYKNRQA
jgi:4-coumarate--CoA ligase